MSARLELYNAQCISGQIKWWRRIHLCAGPYRSVRRNTLDVDCLITPTPNSYPHIRRPCRKCDA